MQINRVNRFSIEMLLTELDQWPGTVKHSDKCINFDFELDQSLKNI